MSVSVIVPLYNGADFIRPCIVSLLAQTLRNLEIIVVDDGSTDNGVNIVREYMRSSTAIRILQREHRGASAARNAGIAISSGDYLGFVDCDDFTAPTMYERLYAEARSEDADIVRCGRIIFETNHPESARSGGQGSVERRVYRKRVKIISDFFAGRTSTAMWDSLFRRSLFDEVTFPEGKISEDAYVLPRLLNAARTVVCLADRLYYHRKHGNSTTSTFFRERFHAVAARMEGEKYLASQSLPRSVLLLARRSAAIQLSRFLRFSCESEVFRTSIEVKAFISRYLSRSDFLRLARTPRLKPGARIALGCSVVFMPAYRLGALVVSRLARVSRPLRRRVARFFGMDPRFYPTIEQRTLLDLYCCAPGSGKSP
jgi:glycosyltransferase involved in cell wall biosynthesis